MKHYSVAIDGPAGAGKSSVVKIVADMLGFKCVDTGAMYRTVALKTLQSGLNTKNKDQVIGILDTIDIKVAFTESGQVMYLDGVNVNGQIRTPEVSQGASDVAVIPEVRLKLVDIQREIAKSQNVIMDGRDIGTFVLPNADVKIFLTASVEERAKRRFKEMLERGNTNVTLEEIQRAIEERDHQDSNRSFAPLKPADTAIIIDTTKLSIAQVVEIVIKEIEKVRNN